MVFLSVNMIDYLMKFDHIISGFKTRFSRRGLIRSQLILSKELVKKYPNEKYAFGVYTFFIRKLLFGKVKYNTL